jgi:hypothetical protein
MFMRFRMTESNSGVATSGNSMAHIYMREGAHWGFRPSVDGSLALSGELYAAPGVTVSSSVSLEAE